MSMASLSSQNQRDVELWLDAPEEEAEERRVSRTLKIVSALLAAIFLFSVIVPIGGAVMGAGQVGVEDRVKRIAHPSGGVIAEIAVRNGQLVEQGDVLMRLEDAVSGAQAEFSGMTVEQLLARRSRLEAERTGSADVRFPEELMGANSETALVAMQDERQLFALRRSEVAQMRAQLGARLEQNEQEIRGYEAQITAFEQQRALIQPELEGMRELWERRLVTINRLNELERTAVSLDGSVASLQSSIAQTRARMSETRQQLIQLDQSRRAQAASELAQLSTALNDQRIRSISAADLQENSEIRAPYAGTVEKLAFTSIGDVVRPAMVIMEIVPEDELMLIEAAVSPADIDRVETGQTARVRFTAFSRASTPDIPGEVTYVATDSSEDPESGISHFIVRIRLDQEALAREDMALRSGMPANVFIETDSRPLISYVTKPILDQIKRAFRED